MPDQVYENIIVWRDAVQHFSEDNIGVQVRVWVKREEQGPSCRMDAARVNHCILNDIDPVLMRRWAEETEPCDDVLEIAIAIAHALKTVHRVTANAVEVTVRDKGSIYYPEWP